MFTFVNSGIIPLGLIFKFLNFPRCTREISKNFKIDLGKFFPNFPQNHEITSTKLTRLHLFSGINCY